MKIFIISLLIASFFISCSAPAEPSNQFRVPHCAPHVTKLPIYQMTATNTSGGSKSSTAVLVGKNTFTTSSHGVFDKVNLKKITIYLPGGVEVEAKVTWFDKSKDIASLQAKSYNIRPIDSMSFNIGPNEQVWNIGYASMAKGKLMSFTGFHVRYRKNGLQVVSALGLHGMSGGATVRCLDDRLELVASITALVNHEIEQKVWTEDGIVHIERTVVNKGISVVTPIKFE